jgi:hypothetical protein
MHTAKSTAERRRDLPVVFLENGDGHERQIQRRDEIVPDGHKKYTPRLMPICQKCAKYSIRRRIRIFLNGTKKPLYYCISCTDKALKDGTVYTRHVLSAKSLGMTEQQARSSVLILTKKNH